MEPARTAWHGLYITCCRFFLLGATRGYSDLDLLSISVSGDINWTGLFNRHVATWHGVSSTSVVWMTPSRKHQSVPVHAVPVVRCMSVMLTRKRALRPNRRSRCAGYSSCVWLLRKKKARHRRYNALISVVVVCISARLSRSYRRATALSGVRRSKHGESHGCCRVRRSGRRRERLPLLGRRLVDGTLLLMRSGDAGGDRSSCTAEARKNGRWGFSGWATA